MKTQSHRIPPDRAESRSPFARGSRFVAPLFAIALVLTAPGASFAESGARIEYELEPPAGEIGPDVDVARLTIRVRSDDGESAAALPAKLRIELDAPPGHALVPTDFPVVEGTPLLRAEAFAQDGEHSLRYLFPIRGEYNLRVQATPLQNANQAGDLIQASFRFTLRENSNEVLNLALLLTGLLIFGGVSGLILGRSAAADEDHRD